MQHRAQSGGGSEESQKENTKVDAATSPQPRRNKDSITSKQSIKSVNTSKLLDQSDLRHPDQGRPQSMLHISQVNKN